VYLFGLDPFFFIATSEVINLHCQLDDGSTSYNTTPNNGNISLFCYPIRTQLIDRVNSVSFFLKCFFFFLSGLGSASVGEEAQHDPIICRQQEQHHTVPVSTPQHSARSAHAACRYVYYCVCTTTCIPRTDFGTGR
jgi:hypothetical protein